MMALTNIPSEVLTNILWFLPQESLLNLALTNYHFYEPCLKHLYRHISIQITPVLKNTVVVSERRRLDHIESAVTTIGGFTSRNTTRVADEKLAVAKLQVLINSIQINPQLAQYIEVIQVNEDFGKEGVSALKELFQTLGNVENTISKIYISDIRLRKKLSYLQICSEFNLTSLLVEDMQAFSPKHKSFENIQELIIAGAGEFEKIDDSAVYLLENVVHFRIKDDSHVYDRVINSLLNLYQKTGFFMKKLKTFNVVHTHDNHTQELPFINTKTLTNFQISLGCDDYENCDQECLQSSLLRFELQDLKRLAIIQNGNSQHNSHKNNEKWDLVAFSFVKDVLESCASLSYLSIRHNVPLDGIIDDGYEGNYLRKVQLYTIVLPRLLSAAQRHVVNLVLPTFVASLACYEQPMNTFLWNGCKCKHCAVLLDKLDEYILYHRYYNMSRHVYKDIQTVQLMRTMSEVLTDRMAIDPNIGDLDFLQRPMKNTSWNFHDNKFSVPFQCLPVKTYDIKDMEDDAEESREGKERYFDAEEKPNDCRFLRKESFFPNYSIVISHFMDDLIRKMINLNRGDAEDAEIGKINDENDGWTNLQINKMLINGIDYNFDHEINGTIFYTNSYDDADFDADV